MTAERKIFISAVIYGILGLVAGFFGRTYNHSMGMEDSNHLSVLHTHILTLGFFFLIALALVGISGLGHILITAGIIIYTATINKSTEDVASKVKC
jgi:hypothetical protein